MNKLTKMLGWVLFLFIVSILIAKMFGSGIDIGDKVVVIPIKGPILSSSSDRMFIKIASLDSLIKKLEDAEEDDSVKGIILEIDSPGGAVVASKQVADKVASIEKPVVALVKGSALSGAYWIASSADMIVSDELSLLGSVGVIGSYFQLEGLMEKYDIEQERLVAGEHKDIASPFRELTDEERDIVQGKVDKIHKFFLKEVKENRGLTDDQLEIVSDARFFLGEEAIELNLIDKFGNIDVAFNVTKELANVTEAKLVKMDKDRRLFNLFSKYSQVSSYNMGRGIGAEIMDVSASKELQILA